MEIERLVKRIDAETARAFVSAARHIIDALLIEAERIEEVSTPAPRNYDTADLPRDTPPGGWIASAELRDTARRMGEAIAAEKWMDGVLFALRALQTIGGV